MKKLLVGIGLVLAFNGMGKAEDIRLVGTWTADIRSKGGLGNSLIFSSDGSMISQLGALVDLKYRIEGQTVFLSQVTEDGSKTVEEKEPFVLSGDKMTVHPDDDKRREVRTRVGEATPGISPIVGLWSFNRPMGAKRKDATGTMLYTGAGMAHFSLPMLIIKGTYKLNGLELTMELGGKPAIKKTIACDGNHLTLLTEGKADVKKFTRITP